MIVIQKLLFNQDECNYIISAGLNDDTTNWDKFDRKYQSTPIDFENNKWVFNRLKTFFESETGIEIKKMKETIHFHRFIEGDWFDEHNDVKDNRVYAVGVLLNDNFEGGDFVLNIDDKLILNKISGNCYIFDVRIRHEICKIRKGIRYSLLWFLQTNHLKFENNII